MKKIIIFLIALVFMVPYFVFADTVSLKVNYFSPRAESDLWQIEFENMDYNKSDFYNTSLGLGYEYFLTRQISFVISLDTYTRRKTGIYNDYVGETIDNEDWAFDYGEGFAINHTFDISITPIQASIKLTPFGRRAGLIPYVGGGAGIYFWSVRLYGYMINFDVEQLFYDPNINADVIGNPIYAVDAREEGKISLGFHAFGGFMIPVGRQMSIDAEFKYNFIKGSLTEGFEGFEPFDLSGFQIALGFSYWF